MVSILFCSTASNVADAGGADGSDDDEVEVSQEQEAGTPDMDIGGETEDSQTSAGTSSRLTMPLPSTPVSRPTLGKRMQHGPKKDNIEEKLLEIMQQPESKPDEEVWLLKSGCKAKENQRSSKEGICTAAAAANTVQLYVW